MPRVTTLGAYELLEHLRHGDRSAASDEERLAWLEDIRDIGRRVSALTAVLLAEADEAGSAMRARHSRLEDWMTRSGQESPREASGAVWAARALERRPVVRDAAAQGRITVEQARAIGQVLDGLPSALDHHQRLEAESMILAEAEHTPPGKLRLLTETVLARVAPERVDSPEARAEKLAERDHRARRRRALSFGAEVDGSLDFGGSLPVVEGRRLQGMIQAIADRNYRSAKDTHDRLALQETPQQRAADALIQVVGAAQSVESAASDASRLPVTTTQLHVLIPYDELLDRSSTAGLLTDGTRLSPGELRIMACSADVIPAVLGSKSEVLDLGRAVRLASPALRRAVGLRDGGCAFPGCDAPLRHCDLHHVTPWQDGGPTNRDNLVALCRVHHSLCEPRPPTKAADGTQVPQDGWDVRIDRRGLPEFLPPRVVDPDRTPVRRSGHAATLFEHSPPARAG